MKNKIFKGNEISILIGQYIDLINKFQEVGHLNNQDATKITFL